jgi:hypothetical protein
MTRNNCKNALVYFDEFGKFVQKSSIESSSLNYDMLTIYESGHFSNEIKQVKQTYSHEPDTYCASFCSCVTDKKFHELWTKMTGEDTGLNDRFMFVLEPETLPQPKGQVFVNSTQGSILTKGEIGFDDRDGHADYQELVNINNRFAQRAEKWAVGFAVDLGLDSVDSDCLDRGCAIVKYELAVKRHLATKSTYNREAALQFLIRKQVEDRGGRMQKRILEDNLDPGKYGTYVWKSAYQGLINEKILREEGTGTKGDPIMVQVLRLQVRNKED